MRCATTARRVVSHAATTRAVSVRATGPTMASDGALVSVREIAGRGRGLVALRTLKRGTRIFDEAPAVSLPTDLFAAPDGLAQAGAMIGTALKAMPKSSQAAFLCLSNCFVGAGRPSLPPLLATFCAACTLSNS